MKKIAVLGGGQVGASVAKILTDDGNDITLVDNNASVLEDLQEDNDIKTIQGNASSPSVLNQVELSDCDILIATTASDEVNLVSCHLAKKMFNVPNVIARLRNAEYREETSDFNLDLFSIDSIISRSLLVLCTVASKPTTGESHRSYSCLSSYIQFTISAFIGA